MPDPHVPETLRTRVRYLADDGPDIWQWSAQVYETARQMAAAGERHPGPDASPGTFRNNPQEESYENE